MIFANSIFLPILTFFFFALHTLTGGETIIIFFSLGKKDQQIFQIKKANKHFLWMPWILQEIS